MTTDKNRSFVIYSLRIVMPRSGFLLLTTLLISIQTCFGANCTPSNLEIEYAEAFIKLSKLSVWGNFPGNATFSINDKTKKNETGYFVIHNPKEAQEIVESGLAESCDGNPLLLKIRRTNGPLVRDGYWPGCSSIPNEDACAPPLKTYYEKFKKNVGQQIIEKKTFTGAYKKYGFKRQLTDLQASIANSGHENFHGFQEDRNDFNDNLTQTNVRYDDCLSSKKWSEQFKNERKWWQSKLAEIYDCKTSSEKLRSIALDFISKVRPLPGANQECNRALEKFELIEGSAQFVGNLALLKSQKISQNDFVEYEKQFFDLSPRLHSYGYIYATGGSISMLLERLNIPDWRQKIENGQTQSFILRGYLASDPGNQCTPKTEEGRAFNPIAEVVKKLDGIYCSK